MKHKYLTLLFLIAVLLTNPSFSQDDKADAIYLKLEKEYTLNEDGSTDFRLMKELKLLTYYSFHRLYGETFIVYNPKYQELKINKSFTVMADGKVVQTPENAFNELLPHYAEDAPDHNYLREMAITHTGLERDAVINLDYTIHTDKEFFPLFYVQDFLQEQSPVDELMITIKVPKGKIVKYKLLNMDVYPVIKEDGVFQVFTWKFNNLPALNYEERQPSYVTHAPLLLFSTAGTRDEFFKEIIGQLAFEYQVNDKMIKKVESLKTDASDDLDLALKIQDYVIDEFKTKYIPSNMIGYKYRQAFEIWESAYGTSAEKMILLTALLNIANLDATPYAVISSDMTNDEVSVPVIDDFAVRVDTKDGVYFYLSNDTKNKQDLAYDFKGKELIPLSFKEILRLHKDKKGENKIEVEGELMVNKEGNIRGTIEAELTNAVNPYYYIKRDENKVGRFISGGLSSSDCKEKIKSLNAEESEIEYAVNSKNNLEKKGSYMFFELPYLTEGIEGLNIHELSSERLTPFKLPYIGSESYKYDITFDENMKAANKGVKIEEKSDIGKVLIEIKNSGKKVVVSRHIELYQDIISPADYPAFRKMMNLWNDRNYRMILIK